MFLLKIRKLKHSFSAFSIVLKIEVRALYLLLIFHKKSLFRSDASGGRQSAKQSVTSQSQDFLIFLMVSEPISLNFGAKKSLRKNWYRKKRHSAQAKLKLGIRLHFQ